MTRRRSKNISHKVFNTAKYRNKAIIPVQSFVFKDGMYNLKNIFTSCSSG
jgi:hypothetical protein